MKPELLEPILKSPRLPEHVAELQRVLLLEQEQRARFYLDITEDGKSEFINGEIVTPSPARSRHITASDNLFELIRAWVRPRRLGRVLHEKALVRFPRNDYEPDVIFYGPGKASGITPDQLLFPIPDFIAEVLSPSTEERDRGIKFQDYEAHRVFEYWIVDPEKETVEQFVRTGGGFSASALVAQGEIGSVAIPDFRIPARAIFDEKVNLEAVQNLRG